MYYQVAAISAAFRVLLEILGPKLAFLIELNSRGVLVCRSFQWRTTDGPVRVRRKGFYIIILILKTALSVLWT